MKKRLIGLIVLAAIAPAQADAISVGC